MKKAAFVLFCLLAAPFLPLRAQELSYSVQVGPEKYQISSMVLQGKDYLSLKDLARAFRARIEVESGSNSRIFIYRDNNIFLYPGSTKVFVNSNVQTLPENVEIVKGEIYVPPEFVTSVFSKVYEYNIIWSATEKAFMASTSDAVTANLEYRTLKTMTRLIFKFDKEVHCTVYQPPGRILVRVQSGTVFSFFDEVDIDDGVVKSVDYKGSQQRGTFVVNLADDFKRFEESIAANPYRIIVDVYRGHSLSDEEIAKLAQRKEKSAVESRVEAEVPPPQPASVSPESRPAPEAETPTHQAPGPLVPPSSAGFNTVVIDPGHGGDEVGATGEGNVYEKEITLRIAQMLKGMLERDAGFRVVLTRQEDTALSLDERTAIANNNKASLFVSIHANSSRRKNAWGAETYFLSAEASDDESRKLAALENNPLSLTGESASLNSDLKLILWDMAQTQYLQESRDLAEIVQDEFNRSLNIRDRGVKQAPFKVLMGAMMPAVLIEIGFLSNPYEEEKLKGEEYQARVATALEKSILRFKNLYETRRNRVP